MANVEEKKLLRTLKNRALATTTALALSLAPVWAQETVSEGYDEPLVDFAPGAQGFIEPSIPQMLEDARRLGEAWKDSLDIQEADNFGVAPDMEDLRDRALANPRVRALLGIDNEGVAQSEGNEARYGNKQVFLLASFSMPPEILQAMMQEAIAADIPVIFRGFVNNSVFDTQNALQEVYGDDADLVGFGIDPTIFTRFQVDAVPQLIVTRDLIDVCETQGCEADPMPVHDRVAGNIPLRDALEIMVRGQGDAMDVAKATLATMAARP